MMIQENRNLHFLASISFSTLSPCGFDAVYPRITLGEMLTSIVKNEPKWRNYRNHSNTHILEYEASMTSHDGPSGLEKKSKGEMFS